MRTEEVEVSRQNLHCGKEAGGLSYCWAPGPSPSSITNLVSVAYPDIIPIEPDAEGSDGPQEPAQTIAQSQLVRSIWAWCIEQALRNLHL